MKEVWKKVKFKKFNHYYISNKGRLFNTKNNNVSKGYLLNKNSSCINYMLSNGSDILRITARKLITLHFKKKKRLNKQPIHLDRNRYNLYTKNLKYMKRGDVIRFYNKGRLRGVYKNPYRPKIKDYMPWRVYVSWKRSQSKFNTSYIKFYINNVKHRRIDFPKNDYQNIMKIIKEKYA